VSDNPRLPLRLLHLNENPLDDFCSFTVLSLAPSPNGRWLAAHTDKGQILLLCLQTGKRVRTLHGTAGDEYSRPVQAWHPAGRYIYASANDTPGTIVVWELASERKVRRARGEKACAARPYLAWCCFCGDEIARRGEYAARRPAIVWDEWMERCLADERPSPHLHRGGVLPA
jgi:WD40 repeat protein